MFNIKNICCKLRLHDLALAEYGRHVGQRHVRSLYYCFKMFTHVLTNPRYLEKRFFLIWSFWKFQGFSAIGFTGVYGSNFFGS